MELLKARLRKAYSAHADEVARHAVTVTFASSPWASLTQALTPKDAQNMAESVFGMLLDGAPMNRDRDNGEGEDDNIEMGGPYDLGQRTDVEISRGAPSLLASLAATTSVGLASYTAAQFAPSKFAVLTPRDIMDLTTGVRTPTLAASGIFEPVAVMLVHNILLAARDVHIDNHLPREAQKLSRDARAAAAQSPSVGWMTPQPAPSEASVGADSDAQNSPWAPKYVHLEDQGADAQLGALDEAEKSAEMLARYINSLDTSDLFENESYESYNEVD
jgi:hypothetical protein